MHAADSRRPPTGTSAGTHRDPSRRDRVWLTDLPDAELVERARDGDSFAFETLVRRYQQAMFALAVRVLGTRPDAQDAVQDALLSAWRKLPQFHGDAAFSTWLYRIVTNRCLNVARQRRSEPAGGLNEPTPPGDDRDDPERHAVRTQLLADLRATLVRLPAEQRICWLLREVNDCSYEEVAAVMDTSVSTVRGRLARARSKLAEAMIAWR